MGNNDDYFDDSDNNNLQEIQHMIRYAGVLGDYRVEISMVDGNLQYDILADDEYRQDGELVVFFNQKQNDREAMEAWAGSTNYDGEDLYADYEDAMYDEIVATLDLEWVSDYTAGEKDNI